MSPDSSQPEQKRIHALLRSCSPFSSLPSREMESLALSLRISSYPAMATIFSEGGAAASFFLVLSGRVRIMVYLSQDRTIQAELLERGGIFGLFCRIGMRRGIHYPCTAVADGPVEAVRIPDSVFDGLSDRCPALVKETCALCSDRLIQMQKLVSFSRESGEFRIAELLLSSRTGGGRRIHTTRHSLSLRAGLAIETVFRVLAEFKKKGWIRTGRGFIDIRAPGELERWVGTFKRDGPRTTG